MGAGSYQVKPSESVYFAGGKVANASIEEEACGCPVAPAGIERAQMEKPSSAVTAEKTTPPVNSAPPPAPPNNVDSAALGEMYGSETRPVPPTTPGEVQVQVDAPFVFRAVDAGPSTATVAALRLEQVPKLPEPEIVPPQPTAIAQAAAPAATKKQRKGFFGRLRGFFVSMFR